MTKAQVLAKAAALNVEVEDFIPRDKTRHTRHIHLYSPLGSIFKSNGCHNACAHDGNQPVDWAYVANEMELEPCPQAGHGCEVCDEELE